MRFQVKMSDVSNIGKALNDGRVITLPQGTTTAFKPIRRGTAHIIKKHKPYSKRHHRKRSK